MCILAVFGGRFSCGWLCPLGAMFDCARFVRRARCAGKLPARGRRVKFILLLILAVFAVCGVQAAWLFDPIVIWARFFSLNVIPAATQAVHALFVFVIRKFGLYGGVYDLYHALKESVLGLNAYYFSHSAVVFLFTAALLASGIAVSRLWCRMLCPLGAAYGMLGRRPFVRRNVNASCTGCNLCVRRCRMEAIADGGKEYDAKECILCMDCVYDCPSKSVSFSLERAPAPARDVHESPPEGISRRSFLVVLAAGIIALRARRADAFSKTERMVIRPPGALPEEEFLDRCIRCGNCMKVCITNGLQPSLFESGWQGLWTPRLVPEIGYCEYHCTLCGKVCPTGALKSLPEQEKLCTKLGTAVIDRSTCLPWAKGEECLVCEEHCPVFDKAIRRRQEAPGEALKPYVIDTLCVGCGICQTKCPVRPVRAIRVEPL
jgi:ferredoxin